MLLEEAAGNTLMKDKRINIQNFLTGFNKDSKESSERMHHLPNFKIQHIT
jgi:hypothetical protein